MTTYNYLSFQSISPGSIRTNLTKHDKGMHDFFDKVPCIEPEDVANALIYVLGLRPEVQVQIIVNTFSFHNIKVYANLMHVV